MGEEEEAPIRQHSPMDQMIESREPLHVLSHPPGDGREPLHVLSHSPGDGREPFSFFTLLVMAENRSAELGQRLNKEEERSSPWETVVTLSQIPSQDLSLSKLTISSKLSSQAIPLGRDVLSSLTSYKRMSSNNRSFDQGYQQQSSKVFMGITGFDQTRRYEVHKIAFKPAQDRDDLLIVLDDQGEEKLKFKKGKKIQKAFWTDSAYDSSETEPEEETTNLCLIAGDDLHQSNEEELFDISEKIHSFYRKIKKVHASLKLEFLNLQKEHDNLRKEHCNDDSDYMKLLDEFKSSNLASLPILSGMAPVRRFDPRVKGPDGSLVIPSLKARSAALSVLLLNKTLVAAMADRRQRKHEKSLMSVKNLGCEMASEAEIFGLSELGSLTLFLCSSFGDGF
ncbi:hypothetical protein M5K25_027680 [Dendrobium thyrsiflorum]|uniref:Uncharacterized protein n=1 Tax=Dendrobium thyrsiflorum TaxID=117978 RepID=A0ABD0TUH1_DENTH